jgi:hypothetical protein
MAILGLRGVKAVLHPNKSGARILPGQAAQSKRIPVTGVAHFTPVVPESPLEF